MTRSIRNFLATHNLVAASARYQEPALNVEQELDTTLLVDVSSTLTYRALKATNREEMTGREEPDRVYDLGGTVSGMLSFSHAQPQHFAFVLGYALGEVTTSPLGEGFRHRIRPRMGEVDASRSNPSFTAAMRFGRQVMKRRFASCFIDQVRVELAKDGWAKLSGVVKGTGKVTDNTRVETLSAPDNAASLTLSQGVEGATAEERLANVQAVQILNPGTQAWEEVHYSGVSGGVPAMVSLTPSGGSGGLTSYRAYYLPRESGWMAFPPRVEEPPLKVSRVAVYLGGRWTGTEFVGGHLLAAELKRLVWQFSNHLSLERTPGGGTDYANRALRTGREQKLTLDRDFRDFLLSQHLKDGDCLGFYLRAQGPEWAPGRHYQVELIFPKVAVVAAPVKTAQRRLAEEVELAVLEDETFGSVIAYVQNRVSGYAALRE
jgi:hypothetical protein